MSQRERDQLKVLHEAEKGHLTESQAGGQLKLSERWVRKLVARLRKEGDGGILHRLRGRASKRKLGEAVRRGFAHVVVETGKQQPEAIGPYLSGDGNRYPPCGSLRREIPVSLILRDPRRVNTLAQGDLTASG